MCLRGLHHPSTLSAAAPLSTNFTQDGGLSQSPSQFSRLHTWFGQRGYVFDVRNFLARENYTGMCRTNVWLGAVTGPCFVDEIVSGKHEVADPEALRWRAPLIITHKGKQLGYWATSLGLCNQVCRLLRPR